MVGDIGSLDDADDSRLNCRFELFGEILVNGPFNGCIDVARIERFAEGTLFDRNDRDLERHPEAKLFLRETFVPVVAVAEFIFLPVE